MVHQYKNNGRNIVLDVNSGSVHVVDDLAYDAIALYDKKSEEEIVQELKGSYPENDIREVLEDIRALIEKVGKALIDSGAVEAFGSILESSVSLLEPLGALVTTILPALSLASSANAESRHRPRRVRSTPRCRAHSPRYAPRLRTHAACRCPE